MEFIYDILLNFQDKYYDFFEWQISDKIINVKKVPLYKITNKDYLNIKYHNVTLQENPFLKKHKIILVTSGLEVMGILLNKNNQVIKKSSLLLEEADDILNDLAHLKITPLKYQKIIKEKITHTSRLIQEKQKFVNNFLSKIDLKKDEYLLKYIYFDIYHQEENNLEKIYNILSDLKNTNLNDLYHHLKTIIIN